MYTPREFFETLAASGDLKEYLFDAFERHSHAHYADMDEHSHILEIKKHVEADLCEHRCNKAVSHEMWAVATLVSQYNRRSNPDAKMPEMLGPVVYNQPAFMEALQDVRSYLQTSELKRA